MYNKLKQLVRSFEEYSSLLLSFIVNLLIYQRKYLDAAKIRKIIIFRLDHLGDVLLSIPAIANIRKSFPLAHITMVVNASSEPLARLIPYVDDIVCYNARFFDRSDSVKILDIGHVIRFLNGMKKKYDLIFDLRGSFISILFAIVSKSKYRFDRGTYLINRKLKSKPEEHEAEINLGIVARSGISIESKEISLNLGQNDSGFADALLYEFGASNLRVIVIHPGSPTILKRWSEERYASLIIQLLLEYPSRVLIIGGKSEKEIAEHIISKVNDQNVIDLTGQMDICQLAAVLKKSDLFIGNDSGPMHLAASCGTKVIGLFGPTNHKRFGPYGSNCITLRKEPDCSPCAKESCKFSNYKCIDQISVDHVMAIARQMLSTRD